MKRKLVQTAAAAFIAAVALLAAPAAATAADGYGGGPTATFLTPDNIFEPGEQVTVLLSGEDADRAELGLVQAAYVSNANLGTVTAAADGSASGTIELPSTATGTYALTLTSPSVPGGYSIVIAADGSIISGGAAGSGSAGGTGGSGSLPVTGMDSASLLGLWVGGGALVLAGGAVAVGAAVHRQRKLADA